jgi:hypothetical protein
MEKPKVKVTITPDDRWEQGIDHDERSVEIFEFMAKYDSKFGGDSMELSSGGDGDNGESLMYLLDEYFAAKDAQR